VPSVEVSEIFPAPNGKTAAEFIEAWHGRERTDGSSDLISIVRIRAGAKLRHNVVSTTARAADIVDALESDSLDKLAYMDGERWNLYHSCGWLNSVPPPQRRGGKDNINSLPGIWLDLDVKDGAFTSQADALSLVDSLGVEPTILVATGSGGVHAYWKHELSSLSPSSARSAGEAWHAHAVETADVWLDKVANEDRVMRLPGSIRWPKTAAERPTSVELLKRDGPLADVNAMYTQAEPAWLRSKARRDAAFDEIKSRRSEAAVIFDNAEPGSKRELLNIVGLSETISETYTWEEILRPHGWTVLETDYEGRTVWSRPGAEGRKSATTDWYAAPHSMSLFSTAKETGLLALHEAGVPLTKYQVYVQLEFNGDEAAFVRAWLARSER